MRSSILPLALVPLLLGGCAGVPYKAKLPETVASKCVEDLHALPQIPLKYFVPVKDNGATAEPYVEFADVAQCFRVAGVGTTPVAVYRLDGVAPPAELTVSVTLSTGGTFAAAVEVLDAEFKSLRRYGFQDFVRRGTEYSLHVFLNQTGTPPAYVMLLADKTQAGKSDIALGSETTPVLIPAGPVFFIYNSGSETHSIRPFLEGGRVSMTAKPQGSAAFSNKK